MYPPYQELLALISPRDREIALANQQIINGPPQWDLITATNPTSSTPGTALEFTFSTDTEDGTEQKHRVEIMMMGRGEGGLYNLKVTVQHPGSPSYFTYLYARSRRKGMLVDVNFIRHTTTLHAGGEV